MQQLAWKVWHRPDTAEGLERTEVVFTVVRRVGVITALRWLVNFLTRPPKVIAWG